MDFILSNRPKSFFKSNTAFTGWPDFHKFVLIYRDFKNLSEGNFDQELNTNLRERCVKNYASFENVSLDTLNEHVPLKKKVIRAIHAQYVTKFLREAVMKRSNLQKIYFLKKDT